MLVLGVCSTIPESWTDEDRGHWNRLCRTRCGRVLRRERQRSHLRRQGRVQGPDAAAGPDSDLRTGARGAGAPQSVRKAADVHDQSVARVRALPDHFHRGRHADGRGRFRRSAARARGGARDRPRHERLQGHRRQEHRPGRHGRARARGRQERDAASLQRRQQSGVPEAGGSDRRLHEARPRGHRRGGSARAARSCASCTPRSPGRARRS